MKIWILTVVAIIALYECSKRLIYMTITKSIRYSMILLFGLSIFSHYYAWWAYVNYYNDDFYSQWSHQMFFSVSITLIIHTYTYSILDERVRIKAQHSIQSPLLCLQHVKCVVRLSFSLVRIQYTTKKMLNDMLMQTNEHTD